MPREIPKMTVMTARGRDSFTSRQLEMLRCVADVAIHTVATPLPSADFAELCGNAQIIGFTRRALKDFNCSVLDLLPRLKAIAVHATGTDWIDVDALRKRNVAFAALKNYSTTSVAEHAMGMLLTMSRRLHLSDRISRGDLPLGVSLRGWELAGKRLGLLGHGQIGARIARLADAFGMLVSWNDPSPAVFAQWPERTFEALLAESDVVMLACSHKRGSPPLIESAQFAQMKIGSFLINPSRSSLVDADAALTAIRLRTLAGYAVDDRLLDINTIADIEAGRLLQTGHTAWYSDEAIARGMEQWVSALSKLAKEVSDA